MAAFAEFMGVKYIDQYIPLRDVPFEEQKERIKNCKCTSQDAMDKAASEEAFSNATYWETDTRGHGWYCSNCGTVLQWG